MGTVENDQCLRKDDEKYEKKKITMEQRKLAAISELKSLIHTPPRSRPRPPLVCYPASTQPSISSSSSSEYSTTSDPALDELKKERDQYRQQAEMYVNISGDLIQQHAIFMEKEKQYQNIIQSFQQHHVLASDTLNTLHDRYHDLRFEAEQKLLDAEEAIAEIQKQHEDDTVAMRYKILQQDIKLTSLESQNETIRAERTELLNMCDVLVAKAEETRDDKTYTINRSRRSRDY
uniref:Transforming acidic coiled-coil-containing protein C-terminal domain-containing protein n=1 Tax=Panagrolaimus sp. ES5 TaxID=591445 RepID=A0AC34G331_9BILA